ncbi:hypothetical protein QGM71_12125 [Virgibacillus sp. C22-A2]|uniref:Surface carbohydrate biosynthesis protein n=1 Tax=Virgibacillus tibetensis TaxID=3042313 RepID=A0ABU6KGF7_9BACI|nr:hypothetical protein [Virgibacillus sp. C22-A2]
MSKNKKWLYLPVEIKVRELDAKLLMAYYAAKEGYSVVTGDHILVEMASTELPAGIFFSKGYPHGFRKRVILKAKENGHVVVELDEEGLLINDKKYLRDRMKRDMLQLVTQEYCWGPFQQNIITSANPDLRARCHVTGNPRIDLLKPKYRSIYEEDAEQLRNDYGEFILINTRFSLYNTPKGQKDNPHFRHIKQLYYSFMEMTKATCERFPEINFVIRPHPGENFESYRHALAEYTNGHVIHEGNIIKWLMAAKAVIHNGCTSGIETFLLEKPLISYVPSNSNTKEDTIPNQLGVKAVNIEEVHNAINDVYRREESNYNVKYRDQNINGLSYYCDWSNEGFAYDAILGLWDSIQISSPRVNTSLNKNVLRIKSKKKRKRRFSLTETEIQDFFNKLDKIEETLSRIIITKLANNLYKIEGG